VNPYWGGYELAHREEPQTLWKTGVCASILVSWCFPHSCSQDTYAQWRPPRPRLAKPPLARADCTGPPRARPPAWSLPAGWRRDEQEKGLSQPNSQALLVPVAVARFADPGQQILNRQPGFDRSCSGYMSCTLPAHIMLYISNVQLLSKRGSAKTQREDTSNEIRMGTFLMGLGSRKIST
jgi:hypothetical protein